MILSNFISDNFKKFIGVYEDSTKDYSILYPDLIKCRYPNEKKIEEKSYYKGTEEYEKVIYSIEKEGRHADIFNLNYLVTFIYNNEYFGVSYSIANYDVLELGVENYIPFVDFVDMDICEYYSNIIKLNNIYTVVKNNGIFRYLIDALKKISKEEYKSPLIASAGYIYYHEYIKEDDSLLSDLEYLYTKFGFENINDMIANYQEKICMAYNIDVDYLLKGRN